MCRPMRYAAEICVLRTVGNKRVEEHVDAYVLPKKRSPHDMLQLAQTGEGKTTNQ